jgi:hypothetical protein
MAETNLTGGCTTWQKPTFHEGVRPCNTWQEPPTLPTEGVPVGRNQPQRWVYQLAGTNRRGRCTTWQE